MVTESTNQIIKSRKKLARKILQKTEFSHRLESEIPGLIFVRHESPTSPLNTIYNPSICLVAQGSKRAVLNNNEEYVYNETDMLITSVGLPVISSILEATPEKPLLSLVYRLDMHAVSQLLVDSNLPVIQKEHTSRGMALCKVPAELYSCFNRMIDLLDNPRDIPIIAPLIHKEIIYRLLMSDLGSRLRHTATAGTHGQQVAQVVNWIQHNFNKPFKTEDLAKKSGMSISTFHNHFREMTAMSPLQFQKSLRLHEARRLMLTGKKDASTAALKVGYESASQFNREYKRMFGDPPLRDIKKLNSSVAEYYPERYDHIREGNI
ncbi:AraC family transcriptional regulator [Maridesulfovibrio bastinii]|jgi:AraC-like DNA-binding protein|uniref:AraC family transcriptional regulator n=1 Tax=Maridesulfovibrio bastinii TaxID=47157 RepID=UPI0004254425|nr:AraC family transcriptional regulator [Maridesulfovibrio bastinii]